LMESPIRLRICMIRSPFPLQYEDMTLDQGEMAES
jgi:hypothetical protein